MSGQIKSFNVAVEQTIKHWALNNIETLDVGLVVGVSKYPNERTVDILPLAIEKYPDGLEVAPPVIFSCPVIMNAGKNSVLNIPPEVGDKVLIGYPKYSIEEFVYSSSSDPYLPDDSSKFQGSQAVVLGYIAQPSQDILLSGEELEITHYDAKIKMFKDGTVNINGNIVTPTGNVITAEGADLDQLKSDLIELRQDFDFHTHTHGDPAGSTSAPVIA